MSPNNCPFLGLITKEWAISLSSSYWHCSSLTSVFNVYRFGSSCILVTSSISYSNSVAELVTVVSKVAMTSFIVTLCCSQTSGEVVGYKFK